jgi:DNA-binding transcriptional MocR family regulator
VTLYQQIAKELIVQIRDNTYQVGERVPSLRSMASQRNVSIATVLEAYNLVEQQGLIETRPQSGYFVCQAERLLTSPPHSKSLRPATLKQGKAISDILRNTQNGEYFHFGLAVPDDEMQPQQTLARMTNRLVRRHTECIGHAIFTPGDHELRRQIALKMAKLGCITHVDNIVITNGCQEAVFLSLQALTKPGDIVAIESPCYHGFLLALESLGLKAVTIATDPEDGMDINALSKAATQWPIKACICSPTLSNPSGACMSDTNKQQLLSLAKQQQFVVIEDDIFGDLYFEAQRPSPLLTMDTNNHVIYCSSFSKSIAPGLRIGWIIAEDRQEQIIERQMASTTGVNALSQKVLGEFLASKHYEQHLKKNRNAYQHNQRRALQTIAQCFPKSTHATQPKGGFILWIALPETVDAYELYQRALGENISIVPGKLFARVGFEHYIRINIGKLWSSLTEQKLARLGAMATKLSQQTKKLS